MIRRREAGAYQPTILLERSAGAYARGPKVYRKVAGVWVTDVPVSAVVAPTTLSAGDLSDTKATAAATVTPANGTAPYSYSWSKVSGGAITITSPIAASTTFSAAGLADGELRTAVFRCTVTDNAGAVINSNTVTVTIERWSQPALAAPPSASASGTAATETTAPVTATVTGGTAPYSYVWTRLSGSTGIAPDSPNAATTTFTASGMAAAGESRSAVFRCTCTGAHGVTAIADVTVTIARSSVPSLSAPPSASAQVNTTSAATGSVTATVTGGVAPYSYSWARISGSTGITAASPSAATTIFNASSLAAGETRSAVFRCTVTDNNGSTAFADVTVTISRYSALTANESRSSVTGSAASATVTSGSVSASASGGQAPYSYSWTRVSGSTAITPVSASSASTQFRSSTVPVGGSQSAVFKCTVTDNLGQVAATGNVAVTLNNTTSSGATYSPVAGTYNASAAGSVSFAVSASSTVVWTWSATSTVGLTATVASGGSGASITFTLNAGPLADRSTTITLTSGGKSWTINLTAFTTGGGGGGTL